jgi:hypothetical protein
MSQRQRLRENDDCAVQELISNGKAHYWFREFGTMPDGTSEEGDRDRYQRLQSLLDEKLREVRLFLSTSTQSGVVERNEPLPFASLSEALANVPPEPPWTWDGYAAPGTLTLLGGKPKVGKSTLLFALLEALLAGLPFLGRRTTETGTLLLSEERHATLDEKARRFNLEGRMHLLMRHQAEGRTWPQIVAESVDYCHQHQLGAIVVDTFGAWAGLRGEEMKNAGSVFEVMQPLQNAAAEGLAVFVAAHQRKADGTHGEAISGSNALAAAVDVVAELERGPQNLASNVRVLRALSRFSATPEEVTAELADDVYRPLGDLQIVIEETEREAVLDVIRAIGAGSAKDVAGGTGFSESTARRRLDELASANRVSREGSGKRGDPYRYSLPEFLSTTKDVVGGGKQNGAVQLEVVT